MGNYVSNSAMLTCTMGIAPSSLMVLPTDMVFTENKPMATIMDHKPFVNVMPFALCNSPLCPTFIKVSATPGPCVPNLPIPWAPGKPDVMVGNKPALTQQCSLTCIYGGMIKVAFPGEMTVQF
ncbi:MAG: DUF4280 domain-containing protein [Mariniphaga sp.]|nr:DUF4280 domain-containing protein [Mariniphaga sp.]